MPLYEYQCEACDRRFELIRKFSDPPVATCPSCGGPVHKLQSAPAFQFKGTGWYVTDYANKGDKTPKADEGKGHAPESATSKEAEAGTKETKSAEGTRDTAPAPATTTAKDSPPKST